MKTSLQLNTNTGVSIALNPRILAADEINLVYYKDLVGQEVALALLRSQNPKALPLDWKSKSKEDKAKWIKAKEKYFLDNIKKFKREIGYIDEYKKSLTKGKK